MKLFLNLIFVLLLPLSEAFSQAYTQKIAGDATLPPDGVHASETSLSRPENAVYDLKNNLYFVSKGAIFKVDTGTGLTYILAGAGVEEFTEGGAARSLSPTNYQLTTDEQGQLIVGAFNRIFRIDGVTNLTETIVGNGNDGYSGDGGAPLDAEITPGKMTVDLAGNIYFADNLRIRRVDATNNIIETVAGTGDEAYSGDGGEPLNASFFRIKDLEILPSGKLYVLDGDYEQSPIREIDLIANQIDFFYDDIEMMLTTGSIAEDHLGRLVYVDAVRITIFDDQGPYRKIVISKAASERCLYGQDDETDAVHEIVYKTDGGYFLLVSYENYIAQFDSNDVEITGFGNGRENWFGDGGLLPDAGIMNPMFIAIASDGTWYIHDQNQGGGSLRSIIRHIDPNTQSIKTVAGAAQQLEVNGELQCVLLGRKSGLAVDRDDNLIFILGPDTYYNYNAESAFVKYSPTSEKLTTLLVEGDNSWDDNSSSLPPYFDPGPITVNVNNEIVFERHASLTKPTNVFAISIHSANLEGKQLSLLFPEIGSEAVEIDNQGVVHFIWENRVWKIVDENRALFVAGNGTAGFSGDGGPAKQAMINRPAGLAFDSNNNLYIADRGNNRIRMVKDGLISTVAGTDSPANASGSGPALETPLSSPNDLAFDDDENLIVVAKEGIFKISGLVDDEVIFGVRSFVLVDPNSDTDIRELKELDYWYLRDLWRPNFRIEVRDPSVVESMVTTVNGEMKRVDNTMPYTLGTEKDGDYERFFLGNGVHTICATPYSADNGQGDAGPTSCITLTMHFTLPQNMTASGDLHSPPGSFLWDKEVSGTASYRLNANNDSRRAFWGQASFQLPEANLQFIGSWLDHFYQRNVKATLFWRGYLNGEWGYLMEQRFLYRPQYTLVRIKITNLASGEIVYDSQRGADPWTRPEQVAFNDTKTISDPLLATINGDWLEELGNIELRVYPNPFEDKLHISIPFMELESAPWSITDMQGRQVIEDEIETGITTDIDVSMLPKGVYIFSIIIEGRQQSLRIVK